MDLRGFYEQEKLATLDQFCAYRVCRVVGEVRLHDDEERLAARAEPGGIGEEIGDVDHARAFVVVLEWFGRCRVPALTIDASGQGPIHLHNGRELTASGIVGPHLGFVTAEAGVFTHGDDAVLIDGDVVQHVDALGAIKQHLNLCGRRAVGSNLRNVVESHGPQPTTCHLRADLVVAYAGIRGEVVAIGGDEVEDIWVARVPGSVLGPQERRALVGRRKVYALTFALAGD
jgi:hypothetical protein